jgi:molybdopterin/thiamine biosynthesis adenylyltransferase
MDTIEVSNLNRQFLFRKEHRGQPKVQSSPIMLGYSCARDDETHGSSAEGGGPC